ncbi:hypothetical protein DFJ74DRAFT_687682 [Hyaloraphidium curvatum]|nr:hypothetical protein DFJ74DRAFT_687682 [Hyaloraphidium curvatum]
MCAAGAPEPEPAVGVGSSAPRGTTGLRCLHSAPGGPRAAGQPRGTHDGAVCNWLRTGTARRRGDAASIAQALTDLLVFAPRIGPSSALRRPRAPSYLAFQPPGAPPRAAPPSAMARPLLPLLLLAAALLAGRADAKAYPGSVHIVNVGADGELKFWPSKMEVRVRDTVIFSAESGITPISHVPSAGSCSPSSPLFQGTVAPPGLATSNPETLDYTFTAPGEYHFAATEHCAGGFRGSVRVLAESEGLPAIPAEFEAATPVDNVPLPDNGVITIAPSTTKKLTQQTPPPNAVVDRPAGSTTTAARPGATTTRSPGSGAGRAVQAGVAAAAVVAGALALL